MRICFFILNPIDFDSRAQLICEDTLASGWELDIIIPSGGRVTSLGNARIHCLPTSTRPVRQRRFIEYNLRAKSVAQKIKADIFHAVDLDTLWAAIGAAESAGGKVVYESRELYTEQYSVANRPLVKAFWRMLEKKLIYKADAIVTVNESIADELVKRYNIKKPEVVMNTARSRGEIKPVDLRQKFNLNSRFVLIFQGVLRSGQGIRRSLKAIAELPDVAVVFVGDGPYKLEIEKYITRLGIQDRIRFAGFVAPEELLNYTAGADAGLMLIEPVALNNYLALPQKIFQYITAATPPIVSNLPELSRVVKKDDLGLVLNNADIKDDIKAINGFLENGLGRAVKACNIAKNNYRWEVEGEKIQNIYRGLCK